MARDERHASLARALDAIKVQAESSLGAKDVRSVRRLFRFSRGAEIIGRVLIYLSFEPLLFSLGVLVLFLHKQLEAIELGHAILHGAYDKLDTTGKFHSKTWRWRNGIDAESWRNAHNVRHHHYTNVAARDPDIHFGGIRLTDQTPHNGFGHRCQIFMTLFVLFPNFSMLTNLHVTGCIDFWFGNGRPEEFDFLHDRSESTRREVRKRVLRTFVPYYAYEYLLWPILAGTMWWKVLLGNWISEVLKELYSAATVFCGHVGEETTTYPAGTRASSRGHWYEMEIEASNNFRVPWLLSILCGGLDFHIEHHLFPQLPPSHLRRIAPQVRAACEEHGVTYRVTSWPTAFGRSIDRLLVLSHETDGRLATNLRHALNAMD